MKICANKKIGESERYILQLCCSKRELQLCSLREIRYMTKHLTGVPPVSFTCDAHDTRVKLLKENRI